MRVGSEADAWRGAQPPHRAAAPVGKAPRVMRRVAPVAGWGWH